MLIRLICDGDYGGLRHRRLREKFTIQDMINKYEGEVVL